MKQTGIKFIAFRGNQKDAFLTSIQRNNKIMLHFIHSKGTYMYEWVCGLAWNLFMFYYSKVLLLFEYSSNFHFTVEPFDEFSWVSIASQAIVYFIANCSTLSAINDNIILKFHQMLFSTHRRHCQWPTRFVWVFFCNGSKHDEDMKRMKIPCHKCKYGGIQNKEKKIGGWMRQKITTKYEILSIFFAVPSLYARFSGNTIDLNILKCFFFALSFIYMASFACFIAVVVVLSIRWKSKVIEIADAPTTTTSTAVWKTKYLENIWNFIHLSSM